MEGTPDPRAVAAVAGSFASSVDSGGRPTFLWSTAPRPAPAGAGVAAAALFHLERHAGSLGLGPRALAAAVVAGLEDRGDLGTVVRIRQQLAGIEVHRRELRLLLDRDRTLVALSGRLEPLAGAAHVALFRLSPVAALAEALSDRAGRRIGVDDLLELDEQGGYRRFQLTSGTAAWLPEPARVKRVVFAAGGELVPAYVAEFYLFVAGRADTGCWRSVVSAIDGRLLERADLQSYDAFTYWVFADPVDQRPLDGPSQDLTPYPAPQPTGLVPPFVLPRPITVDGLNHNPQGHADPWLAPLATQTLGNNVDAYVDRFAPDGMSSGDFRATVSGPGLFDRTYDLQAEPYAEDQTMAGITQAFYVLNWLHDWFYDSGFDEAAGNAQFDNFGRGGLGRDPLKAETQDFSGQNNSNMSTPADGASPRMQIFDWTAPETRRLVITPPGTQAASGSAQFGVKSFDVVADLALVDDGQGTPTDGCEPIVNDLAGKIALVDRGTCSYKHQVVNAEAAGAVGVIVADNQSRTAPPYLTDSDPGAAVKTAPMSITLARAGAIKAALKSGPVTATMSVHGQVDRDGTLDNCVVAHEWGHYLHQRLADCAAPQCAAMSEGWGDFNALLMIVRDGDNLDGTYGMAPYSARSSRDGAYFGIRRQPYSVDLTRDGLTFRHISDGEALPVEVSQQSGGPNSEVHNAGEVWTTMLFEVYVALQKAGRSQSPPLPFDQVRRRMTDYVVAGLKLTPSDATLTEARDAILAAVAARSKDDLTTAAQAFARRGAGACARSPSRDSQDLVGVVEDFSVAPRVALGAIELDDAVRSCDSDGILDAGEQGHLTIELMNGGFAELRPTTLRLSSKSNHVIFSAGTTIDVAKVPPLSMVRVTADVALDPAFLGASDIEITVDVDPASACDGSASRTVAFRVNYDERPRSATSDDVEGASSPWAPSGDQPDKIWSRQELRPTAHVWRGVDWPEQSGSWLESPDLAVSASSPLSIAFDHRFSFEWAQGGRGPVYLDGGVIEVSTDGGGSWTDISTWVDPGYTGTLYDQSGNPLAKRLAFTADNNSWPDSEHVALDLGTQLAGRSIRVRFFIGTDMAAGGFGWELDNLAFGGLDNLPFPSPIDNAMRCPAADAGVRAPAAPGCSCSLTSRRGGTDLGVVLLGGLVLGRLRFRRRSLPRVALLYQSQARKVHERR